MVKNGGNKVTILRTKQNPLSFLNMLAEPFGESFSNYKSRSTSKLLAGLVWERGRRFNVDGRLKVKSFVNEK